MALSGVHISAKAADPEQTVTIKQMPCPVLRNTALP